MIENFEIHFIQENPKTGYMMVRFLFKGERVVIKEEINLDEDLNLPFESNNLSLIYGKDSMVSRIEALNYKINETIRLLKL